MMKNKLVKSLTNENMLHAHQSALPIDEHVACFHLLDTLVTPTDHFTIIEGHTAVKWAWVVVEDHW